MMQITLGQKIRLLRRSRRMTQGAIAAPLMVTPQAVSKWENDISYPDIMLLPALSGMLGVTVDELLSSCPPGGGQDAAH